MATHATVVLLGTPYCKYKRSGIAIPCQVTASSFLGLSSFLCPSVAYTHIMQARAECAVRICKEHVRRLLKSSNAPPRFWPFALMHFRRMYNFWPGTTTPPPWESMTKSRFLYNMESDLHPWGCCYMVAKRPKEHPLVVVDTTHADIAQIVFDLLLTAACIK